MLIKFLIFLPWLYFMLLTWSLSSSQTQVRSGEVFCLLSRHSQSNPIQLNFNQTQSNSIRSVGKVRSSSAIKPNQTHTWILEFLQYKHMFFVTADILKEWLQMLHGLWTFKCVNVKSYQECRFDVKEGEEFKISKKIGEKGCALCVFNERGQ